MPITDLTGYTWVGNSSILVNEDKLCYINFTCNSATYTVFYYNNSGVYENIIYLNSSNQMETAYSNSWTNNSYKTIEITGGSDVSNADLISWLEANGTLIAPQPAITDLTGYTWEANSSIMAEPNSQGYGISFESNSQNYIGLRPIWIPTQEELGSGAGVNQLDYIQFNGSLIITTVATGQIGETQTAIDTWSNSAYKTIVITGGSDVTNATLITWLGANGTLTAPAPSNTYTLTHSLTNLTHGNITFTITPDNGYTYPTTLTVSNGTLVSYDNTTGIAVISGDDTTTVSGECGVVVSGYSVELNYNNNEPSYCEFYYSTDDGSTWIQITNDLSLSSMIQIKFKIKVYNTSGEYWATNPGIWLDSPYTSPAVQVSTSPVSSTTEYTSSNITLTNNMTGYTSCANFD